MSTNGKSGDERQGSRLEVDDPHYCRNCGRELPEMMVDGPIAGDGTEYAPVELCGGCKGTQLRGAAKEKVRDAACDRIPGISARHVEKNSIDYTGEQGESMYAFGVCFEVYGRTFNILDKDRDGVAEFTFSYGKGPEWCVDHDDIPNDVLEKLREHLPEADLQLDPTAEVETNDGDGGNE